MVKIGGMYTNQIIAAVAATLGAFGLGTVLGYTALTIQDLEERIEKDEVKIDEMGKEVKSWIGSILNLGAMFSVLLVGVLVQIIGRKWTMLILSPPFVMGWLIIAFATNHAMLIAGRFITGFCGGGFSLAAPLFVAETADVSIRGALGSGFQVMVTFGILFVYCFSAFLSYKWTAILVAVIPIVFAAVFFFIPESFRYLVSKDKMTDATKSIMWFRKKTSTEVQEELKTIEASVNALKAEESSWGDILVSYHLRPSIYMVALMLFQQLSGINAVIFYSGIIFESSGSDMSNQLSTIIVGIVQFFATCCSIPLVDRAGRKILLLISSAGMCVCLVLLGIYFQLQDNGNADSIGWLPLVSLMIFMVSFSIGYGPVPWMMLGELLPLKVQARVATIATMVNWGTSFIVTKFFESVQDALTIQWCYWIFAIICAVGFVFVFILLPETKGKSLDEIQRHFGNPSAFATTEKKDDDRKALS